MDALAIINKYYPEDNELKHILLAFINQNVTLNGILIWCLGFPDEKMSNVISVGTRRCG